MKKLTNILLIVLMMCGISSCKNDLEPMDSGNHRGNGKNEKPMIKTVRMSFGGDYITESEEPLSRSEGLNTYIGINVFRKEPNKGNDAYENFAYGLFSKSDELSVNLVSGFTYKFEVSILSEKEDGDKLDQYYDSKYGYLEPFRVNIGSKPTDSYVEGSDMYLVSKVDKGFQYYYDFVNNSKDIEYLCNLKYGTAYCKTNKNLSDEGPYYPHPRVKRYYGEKEYDFDYRVTTTEDSIEIPMKYLCFGLRFILDNEDFAGNLKIEDISPKDGYPDKSQITHTIAFPKDLIFSESYKKYEEVYSLYNLYKAYKDIENYSESFTFKFTWTKAVGVTPETFDKTITVHPKKMKTLHINLSGNPVTNTKGNIILNLDEESLTNEDEVINNP